MRVFRTYIVMLLAMLITLSASGVTISLHKCCGIIQGFSLFENAKECEMAKKPSSQNCPENGTPSIQKQSCCSDQKISLGQSTEKTLPVATKTQIKETKSNFDVLFFYTLFQNWFGSTEEEEDAEKPSPGLFISETIILLLKQFRI